MGTFENLYKKIRLDLELVSEENEGKIPATELRKIVMERVGLDRRTYYNVRDALITFGKLKMVNQHIFLFCDGQEGKNE